MAVENYRVTRRLERLEKEFLKLARAHERLRLACEKIVGILDNHTDEIKLISDVTSREIQRLKKKAAGGRRR